MLIPHPSRTPKIAPKLQNKTILGKEKSGWVKIHQKSTKMPFNQKDLGQIFLNQTFLNVLIKTFPKRYDTCRGLFFRPRVPSGAWWTWAFPHRASQNWLTSCKEMTTLPLTLLQPQLKALPAGVWGQLQGWREELEEFSWTCLPAYWLQSCEKSVQAPNVHF